jgi:hypothetical protein
VSEAGRRDARADLHGERADGKRNRASIEPTSWQDGRDQGADQAGERAFLHQAEQQRPRPKPMACKVAISRTREAKAA